MKKTIRLLMILALIIATVLNLAGCQKKPDPQKPVPYKFALYAPLTGDNAQYGQTYKTAIQIYLDKINAEGGINGRPVEIVVYDDKNDPKESLNIANLIVSNKDIIGVIGSQTSSTTLAAAPVFQEKGIPMLTPQASHVNVTLNGKYIFRLTTLATFEGGVIANKMMADGYKKLAVIYANDDYGVNVTKYWTGIVQGAGATVVASETFVSGQTKDFTPLLSKIKAAGADAIYIAPGYSDAAMILTQMKQLDCAFQPYGSSMLYKQEFLDVAGKAAEGLKVCNYTQPENTEKTYVFLSTKYKEKTNKMTDVYVTNSYDCIALLCEAVKAVGTDGAKMADWIAKVKDWQGASGVINFDKDRNPAKPLYQFKVVNGKFELQK